MALGDIYASSEDDEENYDDDDVIRRTGLYSKKQLNRSRSRTSPILNRHQWFNDDEFDYDEETDGRRRSKSSKSHLNSPVEWSKELEIPSIELLNRQKLSEDNNSIISTQTMLALRVETPGLLVFFTTDGSEPDVGSGNCVQYIKPFRLSEGRRRIVKAVAMSRNGRHVSAVARRAFDVEKNEHYNRLKELPIEVSDRLSSRTGWWWKRKNVYDGKSTQKDKSKLTKMKRKEKNDTDFIIDDLLEPPRRRSRYRSNDLSPHRIVSEPRNRNNSRCSCENIDKYGRLIGDENICDVCYCDCKHEQCKKTSCLNLSRSQSPPLRRRTIRKCNHIAVSCPVSRRSRSLSPSASFSKSEKMLRDDGCSCDCCLLRNHDDYNEGNDPDRNSISSPTCCCNDQQNARHIHHVYTAPLEEATRSYRERMKTPVDKNMKPLVQQHQLSDDSERKPAWGSGPGVQGRRRINSSTQYHNSIQDEARHVSDINEEKNAETFNRHRKPVIYKQGTLHEGNYWRSQLNHITSELKNYASENPAFRESVGHTRFNDINSVAVHKDGNEINLSITLDARGNTHPHGKSPSERKSDTPVNRNATFPRARRKNTEKSKESPIRDLIYPTANTYSTPAELKAELLRELRGAGRVKVVQELLAHGADPNWTTPEGGVPMLTVAAAEGFWELIPVLIDAGAAVNARTNAGNTALHKAVTGRKGIGSKECVLALLECGAFPGVKNNNGKTPHELAIAIDRKDIAICLSVRLSRKLLVNTSNDRKRSRSYKKGRTWK